MKIRLTTSTLLALSVAACGGGGGDDDGSDAPGDADGGSDGDDETDAAPDADGFAPIVTVDWTLDPPEGANPDKYWCASRTLTHDTIITGFRAISPGGTHHTVLSVGSGGADDPGSECSVFSNHSNLLFASGVGTDDFVFPDGVGLPLQAGQQIFVNVHLFNATDSELDGTSGVAVTTADSVEIEAEFTFAGTLDINIPEDSPPTHEESGTCTMQADAKILNWWPHMHQLGRNMAITVNGDEVFDQTFNFLEQKNYPVDIDVEAGDVVGVTCTYEGHPDQDVGWGDSSNQEMCFAGFYRYPRVGEAFCDLGI
ncbi:MAG TPA: hypothetical protein VMZ28_13505 [Kofleriaceae bacterium]|nr:hypothetical protein [Kofleriaceae bacterium]